jgi:hypothetical protein
MSERAAEVRAIARDPNIKVRIMLEHIAKLLKEDAKGQKEMPRLEGSGRRHPAAAIARRAPSAFAQLDRQAPHKRCGRVARSASRASLHQPGPTNDGPTIRQP